MVKQEPINTDSEGLAYTINTRYGCMGYGNVSGGSHYPMTAVSEHDGNYPPLPDNLDLSKMTKKEVKRAADELKKIAQASRSCDVGVTINPDNSLRPFNKGSRAKDGISEYCTDYECGIDSTTIAARPNKVYGDSTRYRIRKLTPVETGRLMGMDDEDIQKMKDAGLSKSAMYKLHGNSIVVDVLFYIFRNLFIDEFKNPQPKGQLTLDF
jgi:site-specific DNA-cytosine methylase